MFYRCGLGGAARVAAPSKFQRNGYQSLFVLVRVISWIVGYLAKQTVHELTRIIAK